MVLLVTHPDGPGPVVAPLDHRARLQVVRPQLVNVLLFPHVDLGPKAERHQVLAVAAAQQRHDLLPQLLIRLGGVYRRYMKLFFGTLSTSWILNKIR